MKMFSKTKLPNCARCMNRVIIRLEAAFQAEATPLTIIKLTKLWRALFERLWELMGTLKKALKNP
jgi:hypothetical protein